MFSQTIQNFITSLIRTYAGFLVSWLLSLGIAGPIIRLFGWDSATAQQRLVAGFVLVGGAVYYFLVRLLEEKIPALGTFLGVAQKPVYSPVTADGVHVVTSLPAKDTGVLSPDEDLTALIPAMPAESTTTPVVVSPPPATDPSTPAPAVTS